MYSINCITLSVAKGRIINMDFIRLVKTEFYKILKSDFYHRFFVIYLIVSIATLSQVRGTKSGFFLTGYEWFCVRQLMGGWVWMPVPFFVAEYMATEFTNNAFVSALMCGYTRKEIFRVKGIICMFGILGLRLTNTIVGTLITTLLNGFGAELNRMTVIYMVKRFTYYLMDGVVTLGVIIFIIAVIIRSKVGTIVLSMISVQLSGSLTAYMGYSFNSIGNTSSKELIYSIIQCTPLYQLDSLLVPEYFRPHQFWQYLLSCSVCLIGTYLITIYKVIVYCL